MSELTRAQRARLGIFVVVAAVITAVATVALVGTALLEERDAYDTYFEGSVNGLEAGSSVKYNGISVGRVEELSVDPDRIEQIRVQMSLHGGTPIKTDTVAVLSLQGITGQMYIELTGGTQEAETLAPGSTIASKESALGSLLERADSISQKLESLVDNLVLLTSEENAQQISATLQEVRAISARVRELTDQLAPQAQTIVNHVEEGVAEITELLRDGRVMVGEVTRAVERVSSWVDPAQVSATLNEVQETVRTAGRRLGSKEMGAAIQAYTDLAVDGNELVGTANLTLLRARDDILRALDEFVVGAENFALFAAILRDDPSALLRGRTQAERDLQ